MRLIDESWLRDPPSTTQMRRDVVLGLVLVVCTVLAIGLQRSAQPATDLGWHGLEGYLWAVGVALPLTVRRRFPLVVMLLCAVSFYAMGQRLGAVIGSFMVQICFFMTFYTAWAWSRRRRRLVAVTAVVVLAMLVWVLWQLASRDAAPAQATYGFLSPSTAAAIGTLVINLLYFFGAIAWGVVSWHSARQRHDLRVQAEQLRRQQEANAERAVADERVWIARDLHDVIAHHVSGIGIQAAGARRLLGSDPQKSQEALQVIEHSSRQAVAETQQLVSLLRSDDGGGGAREPRPGLERLEELASEAGNGSLRVDLRTVGPSFEVPEGVGVSLYRAVQEALTNVRRHSTARRAEVVLRYLDAHPRTVEVEVLDDGHPAHLSSNDGASGTGGYGLRGIVERANVHGGETEIGPRPDGGFRVRMRVPVETS